MAQLNREYQYKYLSSNSTTGSTALLLTGKGFLHNVTKTNTSGLTGDIIKVFDATSGTSTSALVGFLPQGTIPGTYNFDVSVSNGLKVTIGNNVECTVSWSQS